MNLKPASDRLYELASELLDIGSDGGLTTMQVQSVIEEAIEDWIRSNASSMEDERE